MMIGQGIIQERHTSHDVKDIQKLCLAFTVITFDGPFQHHQCLTQSKPSAPPRGQFLSNGRKKLVPLSTIPRQPTYHNHST